MLNNRNIAIISPNTLLALGLQKIFDEYFSSPKVFQYDTFDGFICAKQNLLFELVFIHAETLALHFTDLHPFRTRIIVLSANGNRTLPSAADIGALAINSSESEIVATLEKIIPQKLKNSANENNGELSEREIEVLKMVALGKINKQIADKLHISLHTVVSHRKNITRKLGIKTVPGLTVYAILNGIVNSAEID